MRDPSSLLLPLLFSLAAAVPRELSESTAPSPPPSPPAESCPISAFGSCPWLQWVLIGGIGFFALILIVSVSVIGYCWCCMKKPGAQGAEPAQPSSGIAATSHAAEEVAILVEKVVGGE